MIRDNHGRIINYARIAVTDRCNLRCNYCMPEHGLEWLSRNELLTYEELIKLCDILIRMGITKIRITGGEPFVRKDILHFISTLSGFKKLDEISITTNGVLTAPFVPELKKMGIRSVNLSLDTLDRERFFSITRRDELPNVLETLDQLLKYQIEVKTNAVVMDGKNTQDIIPLVQLARELPVVVRFIEEMPFNGTSEEQINHQWNHIRILETIKKQFPDITRIPDPPFSTSCNYRIPGFKGTIGIIAAYTRSFCGTCNRLRITPEGMVKTCLYDAGVLNIKQLMRDGFTDEQIERSLMNAFQSRSADGWEAERKRNRTGAHESMAAIGG